MEKTNLEYCGGSVCQRVVTVCVPAHTSCSESGRSKPTAAGGNGTSPLAELSMLANKIWLTIEYLPSHQAYKAIDEKQSTDSL